MAHPTVRTTGAEDSRRFSAPSIRAVSAHLDPGGTRRASTGSTEREERERGRQQAGRVEESKACFDIGCGRVETSRRLLTKKGAKRLP